MKNEACTYILIIANNDLDKLRRTVDSLLKQTVERELLRILIIDNASQNDTYSRLIDCEIEYPELISVIREKKPTTKGRLLKRMIRHLRYAEVGSSMILEPGDIICPDLIKNANMILRLKESLGSLIYETDIWDGQTIKSQTPIFTSNCVITKLCEDVYYKSGIGHKVLIFHRGLPIGLTVKLPYYEVVVKSHDWLSAAYHRNEANGYMKETGGCIYTEAQDMKKELIEWSFFIKRNFYAIETQVFSTKNSLNVQKEAVYSAYNCLSIMALQYAVQILKKGAIEEAEDILIFAEMMNLDIENDSRFLQLRQAVLAGNYEETLETLFVVKSEIPPRVSFQF